MKSPYFAQTPQFTLHEIAQILWQHGEHAAYRSLQAHIKERDTMLSLLKELDTEANWEDA